MVSTKALIKSSGGTVYHYGHFNHAVLSWFPDCGQCITSCSPFREQPIPDGLTVKICSRCLNHQLSEPFLEKNGLERLGDTNKFRVTNKEKFLDGTFTVGELFRGYKKGLLKKRS